MKIDLCLLAEKIFQRYGTDRGTEILCRGNLTNLAKLYLA